MMTKRLIFLYFFTVLVAFTVLNGFAKTTYHGINLSGAEFKRLNQKAKHQKDYIWPSNSHLVQMQKFGFNTIRVPFSWARMQPNNLGPLSPNELKQLDRIVQKAHQINLHIVIDPHSYGDYKGKVLKPNKADVIIFDDFLTKLANHYASYPNVIFGLMNEPYRQTPKEWAVFAQVGINAIRNAGAKQLILVPGTKWSGMHSWLSGGANSNAQALIDLVDPLDNFAFEMHQYFDKDFSGTHHSFGDECVSEKKIISIFKATTKWLADNNKKAFLGEFGAQENDSCINALKSTLSYLNTHQSEWVGWTYWATSRWMPNYPFNIFNKNMKNKRKEIVKDALND